MALRIALFIFLLLCPLSAWANYTEFNGSTDYGTAPTDANMSSVPLIFYVEVKPTVLSSTLGHDQVLFSKLNASGSTYELSIDSADDKIHFRTNIGGAGGVNIVDDAAITANTHYHVIVVINGSRGCTMYVNSTTAEASTGTSAALDVTGAGDLRLGGIGSGDQNFQGYYYMFRMWNLEVASISIPATITGFGQASGKIHEFGFLEDDGDDLYNTADIDHDGTLFGGTRHVRQFNYEIPEEHNYKYHPMEMTGTMWDNMGISREVEPYASGDYSWAYNPKCDEPQYRKLHVATDGDDVTGDGSEGNPFATFEPIFNQYTGIGEYGDCVVVHAGEYFDVPSGINIHNYIANPGSRTNKFIITGAGDGEVILRFDHTNELTWSAYDSNIQKTNWFENLSIGTWPGNVVLDDNWPYGTRRVWALDDIERDGDWFFDDKLTSTTTGAATGKLIDSTANFGNETPPTEVGHVIAVPSISPNFKTLITAIDSPTQLSVNSGVPAATVYEVWRDLYIHTSGQNPFTERMAVIPSTNYATDDFGLNFGGGAYSELYGLTFVGAGTYSVGGFTSDYTPYIDISHVVSKYSGKGTASVGKYSSIDKVVSFGQGINSHGNGTYGIGGTDGGWPSVCGCRSGCIVGWSYGEGVGGQANPTTNYGDTRIVENSIIINSWSVNLYPVDTTFGATLRNNIVFNHEFRPTWTLPASEIEDRGLERSRIWRRMMPIGFLYGDEVAAAEQTVGRLGYLNIHNNIFVNTRGCNDVFKEIALPLGMNHIDFVHNICVTPQWDGIPIGAAWNMIETDKISGGIYNDSSRFYNNVLIGLNASAFVSIFNSAETNTAISGLHLDHNYYFVQNPRSFVWKLITKDNFAAFQADTGQDENSTLGTVSEEDVISPAIIGRADWGADVINMTIDDFTPPAGSPLINTGTLLLNEGGTRDFDFQLDMNKHFRPLGTAPDIGPIEHGTWYPRNMRNGAISGGSF